MSNVITGRNTVDNSEPIVVFLIGARVNRWWLLPIVLPILSAMPRMLGELAKDRDSGFLGVQSFGFASAQYWRSVDHLLAYASHRERTHQPTVVRYFKKLFRGAAAGIWHEIYYSAPGAYEGYYINMPTYGLGRTRPLQPAQGPLATTRGRLWGLFPRQTAGSQNPEQILQGPS